jgi:hypothetical protein
MGHEGIRSQESGNTPMLIEPLAVDAAGAAKMFCVGLRTWRRWDSSGRCPAGYTLGGRKLYKLSDLRLWCEWDFPDRQMFEERLRAVGGAQCKVYAK